MAVPLSGLLEGLRYAFPTLLFVCFLSCLVHASCTLQNKASAVNSYRRDIVLYLLMVIAVTYAIQCILALAYWYDIQQDRILSLFACSMLYTLEIAILCDSQHPTWYSYAGSLGITLAFDPLLAALSLRLRKDQPPELFQVVDLLVFATRLAFLVAALLVCFNWSEPATSASPSDNERQSLLRGKTADGSEDTLIAYGTTEITSDETSKSSNKDPESEWERSQRLVEEQRDKRLKESGNWFTYAQSFKLFIPYIWPVNDRRLQVHAVLVGLCMLINNGLNVLIPNQLGVVTKALTEAGQPGNPNTSLNPWIQVLIFAGLKLCASEAGLSLLRQRLWLPVEQYSERAMVEAAHSHIMNLDAHFHDTKSLSDMLMAIQHGESITKMLDTMCFSLLPNLIDLGVAFIYLTAKFGPWEGLITISTATFFIHLSTAAIARSRATRQAYSKAWYEEWYIMNSGLSGWTTVASFNQVEYETNRFSAAVQDRIAKSKAYVLNVFQSQALQYLVLSAGLLAGLFLAVWKVTHEHSIDASDFVVLLTYWSQLVGPLNFFAGLGKSVNRDLIDAERLLEIMETQPRVVSKPNVPDFRFDSGLVEFKDVHFSYDKKKEILKGVSFTVLPGQTIALVGHTGAGKSSILKLLDRFYDVTEGQIRIDGQDVRDVDLRSLRAHIGVVPQNPVLFNDSVLDNVRYARLDASDEEVYNACKAAAIHDHILGFGDGYNTRVGERGMKLSGGELQRVAIARAILKQPSIVLLDEATSAVDTETESKIQEALRRLGRNRTTFIVAHRLSTIINADRILVVNDGEILEDGTHESLISAGGKYADLWSKQIFITPKDSNMDDDSTLEDSDSKSTKNLVVLETRLEGSQSDEADDGSDEEAVQMETPSGRKNEASRLNPHAQEFTPRSAVVDSENMSPTGKTTATGHDPFCQTVTPVPKQQAAHILPVVSLPMLPSADAQATTSTEEHSNVNGQDTPTGGATDGTSKPKSDQNRKTRKVSYKIPRYNRRYQSRSQPAESTVTT